jgi:hypothetical protein
MADERLPLLRGRISSVDTYEAPQRRGPTPKLPTLDPSAHRTRLLKQLDAIANQVKARAEAMRDELASREIIAVRSAPKTQLAPDQLDDVKTDARLVGVIPETGTVLLDVADPYLKHLRKKIKAFGDDTRVKTKTHQDGSTTISRAKERAIAPVDSIALAALDDVRGPRLRAETLVSERAYWFEIACRGGYRQPLSETQSSREQIARQLYRIGAGQKLDEFIGPEQVYFFVRLASQQLEALRAATDCIYEVELAPPPLRDLKLLDDVTTRDVRDFSLQPPGDDAPGSSSSTRASPQATRSSSLPLSPQQPRDRRSRRPRIPTATAPKWPGSRCIATWARRSSADVPRHHIGSRVAGYSWHRVEERLRTTTTRNGPS